MRVLLVEDNEINQQIAVELLQLVGLEIEVAHNGRVALQHLLQAEHDYDLLLMDLEMPDMDGHEATIAIRAQPRGVAAIGRPACHWYHRFRPTTSIVTRPPCVSVSITLLTVLAMMPRPEHLWTSVLWSIRPACLM